MYINFTQVTKIMTKTTVKLDSRVHAKVKAGASYQGLNISEYLDKIAPEVEIKDDS